MLPLERLFLLELEFQRLLRTQAPDISGTHGLHTSYALQAGYEPLIRAVGVVTHQDIEQIHQRHLLAGDTRDLLAARDSMSQLLVTRLRDL